MRYTSYEPPRPLGDFVRSLWYSSYTPSHPRVRILPRGTIELIINLSEDEIRIYDADQPEHCQRLPGIVVSGAYAGTLDIDPMQHASMMGVHFRPGGAYPFLGADLGELANSHVALECLWGRSAIELRERLCVPVTAQKRFQILADALLAQLGRVAEHPAVSLALDLFGPAGMGGSVRGVAGRLGLSQRRLIQVFTAQVGLTPKRFCRVLRFKHARQLVDQAETLDWSQVSQACGYYDQSHLIRDFQEFTGLSPTGYADLWRQGLVQKHVLVPE